MADFTQKDSDELYMQSWHKAILVRLAEVMIANEFIIKTELASYQNKWLVSIDQILNYILVEKKLIWKYSSVKMRQKYIDHVSKWHLIIWVW